MGGTKSKRVWIDDEYDAKLGDLTDEYDLNRACLELKFREHCEAISETTAEHAPAAEIRRLAFRKVCRHLSKGHRTAE